MTEHEMRGIQLRDQAKLLILSFMQENPQCQKNSAGMKLAQIFRDCGLDWGEYQNSTSSNQQYWVVALVRELEKEGKVERVSKSGPWRLL